ncbi:hypothetical protein HDU67_008982 [Dinochytrium kinnereticum]|nr:hypothetical protein HDU67_008982 [Dinochytrium kinnereticum]
MRLDRRQGDEFDIYEKPPSKKKQPKKMKKPKRRAALKKSGGHYDVLPPTPPKLSAKLIGKEPFMTKLERLEVMRLVPGPKPSVTARLMKMFKEAGGGGRERDTRRKEHVEVHYYVRGKKAVDLLRRLKGIRRLLKSERVAKVYELAVGKGKGECREVCEGVDFKACADCSYRHLSDQLQKQRQSVEEKKERYYSALLEPPEDGYKNPPLAAPGVEGEGFETDGVEGEAVEEEEAVARDESFFMGPFGMGMGYGMNRMV